MSASSCLLEISKIVRIELVNTIAYHVGSAFVNGGKRLAIRCGSEVLVLGIIRWREMSIYITVRA